MDGRWILNQPLNVQSSEDHPYLGIGLGTLGAHEVVAHLQNPGGQLRVFLDGEEVYAPGDPSPRRSWFNLCREMGYRAEEHWDWDPALILFRQVVPALSRAWEEAELPYGPAGVPEGVLCLGTLRMALEVWASHLHSDDDDPASALVARTFQHLPLRAVP